MDRELNIIRVHLYQMKKAFTVAKILNRCGKDMSNKYGLHHWDNPMIKSCVIVFLCLLKNQIYLVLDAGTSVATFQIKVLDDVLFFEKLAVAPNVSGKGYGSYCMKLIEKRAIKLGLKKVRMEVYDQSEHAIDFYKHKGYSQVGETGTLKYTDLVMEKAVGV